MKTKYRFIHFEKHGQNRWFCKNNQSESVLTGIVWYPRWRCYCTEHTVFNALFNSDCHKDIADFLEQLNKERKR